MAKKPEMYNGTGRRKNATARAYLYPSSADDVSIVVNERTLKDYFGERDNLTAVESPLILTERADKYKIKILVRGGGVAGQAGAVRHAISRALIKAEPELRAPLKSAGFLTRDAREVERKKPGRHKARKRPQFSKR